MRLSRLRVKNFRNLADIDVLLGRHTVVVGENRSGKSNLLQAMRLVMDSTISADQRRLSIDDFWDGLSSPTSDPTASGHAVEVSVDITEFDDEAPVVAALSDALVTGDPLTARLTYRWEPDESAGQGVYRSRLYGGDDLDRPIAATDVRERLITVFMHALRDVESDVRSWRRSPLRALLEGASKSADAGDLEQVRSAMQSANDSLNAIDPLVKLGQDISSTTRETVGTNQGLETSLGAAPPDPRRLIRSMQIFVDGDSQRQLTATSLGALNILYFTLLELRLNQRLSTSEVAHVVLAVEEPEAHLHPHLQRLLLRHLQQENQSRSTVVTTHSPHLASATSARNLIMLRTTQDRTVAHAAADAHLSDAEWDDIDRYLDATRSELVFARRVLLVEGVAEQLMVPSLAKSMDIDLDEAGISVCAIGGTHFDAYVRLCTALDVPYAVLTDGDPGKRVTGERRRELLMQNAGASTDSIFVGSQTFEHDLIVRSSANLGTITSNLRELLVDDAKALEKLEAWQAGEADVETYLDLVENAGGKGRFAQRLASARLDPPEHLQAALEYLSEV